MTNTVLHQGKATHLFRFCETFTAPDELHLSLNTTVLGVFLFFPPVLDPEIKLGCLKKNLCCFADTLQYMRTADPTADSHCHLWSCLDMS